MSKHWLISLLCHAKIIYLKKKEKNSSQSFLIICGPLARPPTGLPRNNEKVWKTHCIQFSLSTLIRLLSIHSSSRLFVCLFVHLTRLLKWIKLLFFLPSLIIQHFPLWSPPVLWLLPTVNNILYHGGKDWLLIWKANWNRLRSFNLAFIFYFQIIPAMYKCTPLLYDVNIYILSAFLEFQRFSAINPLQRRGSHPL